MEVAFEELGNAELVVDTVYKGGKVSGKGSEVLSKLLPGCSNSGGFRKVLRKRWKWTACICGFIYFYARIGMARLFG